MRCPKCQYISFDDSDRCRNCGYEFSLSVDAPTLDLPIQTGDEAIGPLSDFALGDLDGPEPAPKARTAAATPPAMDKDFRGTPASAPDLPLFKGRMQDEDAPLVNPSAVPRAPLAVRRSNPTVPRPRRSASEEPELELDLPDFEAERDIVERPAAAPAGSPDPADSHAAAGMAPRILAGLIDLAILGGIDAAVLYFTLKICGFGSDELWMLPLVPLAAFLLLLNGGYFVAFIAAGGQTIGKMAAGIKVVAAGEGELSWSDRVPVGTAFVRAAASLVSLAPAGAGWLPAFLSADHRAVHDRLAHTRVVKA